MGVCIGVFAYVFYGFLLRITTGCIFVKILGHIGSCLPGAYVQIKGGDLGRFQCIIGIPGPENPGNLIACFH
jgi:hypothetical protein